MYDVYSTMKIEDTEALGS